jgi:hypothetical protein
MLSMLNEYYSDKEACQLPPKLKLSQARSEISTHETAAGCGICAMILKRRPQAATIR